MENMMMNISQLPANRNYFLSSTKNQKKIEKKETKTIEQPGQSPSFYTFYSPYITSLASLAELSQSLESTLAETYRACRNEDKVAVAICNTRNISSSRSCFFYLLNFTVLAVMLVISNTIRLFTATFYNKLVLY